MNNLVVAEFISDYSTLRGNMVSSSVRMAAALWSGHLGIWTLFGQSWQLRLNLIPFQVVYDAG
jgi:hypothetical protein